MIQSIELFTYQMLYPIDPIRYTLENIQRQLYPYATTLEELCTYRFDPKAVSLPLYQTSLLQQQRALSLLPKKEQLPLQIALFFLTFCTKTTFYTQNSKAVAFRVDPSFFRCMPSAFRKKFPHIPYAIFFVHSPSFLFFHTRFQDIARGGLRTVIPEQGSTKARDLLFSECYLLSYTQKQKNKEIPEGGAKGVLLLQPGADKIQAQKDCIATLLQLVHTTTEGVMLSCDIVDYEKKAEYLYFGPDENMEDSMIHWIADYSKNLPYLSGEACISSKIDQGFNHKKLQVTACGLYTYLTLLLPICHLSSYSFKMTGGPSGDVAGGVLRYLHRHAKDQVRVVALLDHSAAIIDPKGLDLSILVLLCDQNQPLSQYPITALSSEGRFVLGEQDHSMVHTIPADIFLPAGGRPHTVSSGQQLLDTQGIPTSKLIIEGANIYFTPQARIDLEEKGCLVLQDSSANKGGVICSSWEVLANTLLSTQEFLERKPLLIQEVLANIQQRSLQEGKLLLSLQSLTQKPLSLLSTELSTKMLWYRAQIASTLQDFPLAQEKALRDYVLPSLQDKIEKLTPSYAQAIACCHLASTLVYEQGIASFKKNLTTSFLTSYEQKSAIHKVEC